MKVTNMIPKDFSAAVKDIKLAILRPWAPCSEIRQVTKFGGWHVPKWVN